MTDTVYPITFDPPLPTGYTVTSHQERGYDSPAKWFEIRYKGVLIPGSIGSRGDCVRIVDKHKERTTRKDAFRKGLLTGMVREILEVQQAPGSLEWHLVAIADRCVQDVVALDEDSDVD